MNLEDAFGTFLEESAEQLDEMERLLLDLESGACDSEQLNALFRSVHTIKGSAGLFGLDHVVAFTHVVETVLDRLRGGQLAAGDELVALLLRCRDQIALLIDMRDGAEQMPDVSRASDALLQALEPFATADANPVADALAAPAEEPPAFGPDGADPVRNDAWHISVRFGAEVFRHGLDPLGVIRYLGTVGELVYVTTVTDALPSWEAYDPESCYLGFEIDLRADVDKASIEEAFEFVRDDCELHVLPPRSRIAEYARLIKELPEGSERLGDILVASGALTPAELEEGLRMQRAAVEPPNPPPPIGQVLVGSGMVQPELVQAALTKQRQVREGRGGASAQYLRVHAEKLDQLINLVGELVIASASASLMAQQSGHGGTQEAVSTVSGLVEEIRDSSLQLRMVPIGETFQRFQRVVRDVSRELGKDIDLEIAGAETELDKTVVEKIGDPLTHLVRNAIDHGIEPSEIREATGKSARGTVRLDAYHDSGSIVIEVGDDGGGLDQDRILAKALEKGLISSPEGLSAGEINQMIFSPGFSTASSVTNLSGRGVGMDVVKSNIEALRGTVEVHSSPGAGTTFSIRLPLTLAIIDGFLMKVGDAAYVVPLESVVECVEYTAEEQDAADGRDFVNLRGQVLPLIRLREHFCLPFSQVRRQNIVVVRYAGKQVGLVVDALMGEHQTVIKPLGRLFASLTSVSGSTILGDGRVALILDVPALTQRAAKAEERVAAGNTL